MKGYMYILHCSDDSYYTGSTNNLELRLQQHQNGEGANHTKKHLPVKLVYFEEFQRIDEAFNREKQVQGWSRKKKEALINGMPDALNKLAECKNESHFLNRGFESVRNGAFDSAQASDNTNQGGFDSGQMPENNFSLRGSGFGSAQPPEPRCLSGVRCLSAVEGTLPKYSNYKPSGVEWLGEIPKHWKCIRMKHLFKNFSEKNKTEAELLSVTQNQGVVPRTWVDNRMVMPSGALYSFKFIQKGDFAISLRSFEGGLEYCYHDGIISPAYTVLKTKRPIDSQYYKYLFKSFSFISELQTSVVGIREGKNISYPELSYSYLPVPNLEEQTAIATFLDHKTALIDQAIGIKEKQIELLKERRQILIHKAVTCGIGALSGVEVPMKDSGVEWIGEIPEHWEVKKIKHISSKIGSGITPSGGGTTYLDEGIPLLRSQNILFGKIELEGVAYISEKTHNSMSNSQVKKGDVLLNITGGSIGRCHYIEDDMPYNVNQHVSIIRPKKEITTIFLNSLLSSEIGQGQIWFNQQGGGREGLSGQSIKNFFIPLPSIKEQKEISDHIEAATTKFTTAITLKEQEIEKLKEYKSTLINSAVTGKIKV